MAVPRIVTDGDYTVPKQIGAGLWSTPFSLQGDNRSAELRLTFRVDADYYHRTPTMKRIKTSKGYMYLVEEGETSDAGNGILQYTQTYASVPETRAEYSTIAYTRQGIIDDEIVEVTETCPCKILYEYSLKPFAQIDAPKVVKVAGAFMRYGGWGRFVPGNFYLAEDTEVGVHKAEIYFRKSVLIRYKELSWSNPP